MLKIIFSVLILATVIGNVQAQEPSYELLGSYKMGGYVRAVSVSSNGTFIAGSSSGEIYSFDKEGKPLWNIHPQNGWKEMKVCPDGEYIALRYDGQVYLFNKDGNQLDLFSRVVHGLSMSPDCSNIAVGSRGGDSYSQGDEIIIFNKKEAKWLGTNAKIPGIFNTLSISSNGSYIAAGYRRTLSGAGLGDEISIWNEDYFYPVWSFQTDSEVRIVSISADGSFLSAASGNNMYFYDITHRQISIKDIPGINTVSVSSNGSYIVTGSGNDIYLFNRNGTLLWDYNTNNSITDLTISSDGSRIAAGSGRDIYIFDNGGTLLWSYRTGDDILSVSLSPDGYYAAAGSKDSKVYFIGEKVSPAITPVIHVTSIKSEAPVISISTQTPETSQNMTPPIKSTPFLSVFLAIVMLLAVRRWQNR